MLGSPIFSWRADFRRVDIVPKKGVLFTKNTPLQQVFKPIWQQQLASP